MKKNFKKETKMKEKRKIINNILSFLILKQNYDLCEFDKKINEDSIYLSIAIIEKLSLEEFEFVETFITVDGYVNLNLCLNSKKTLGLIVTPEFVHSYFEINKQITQLFEKIELSNVLEFIENKRKIL